MQFWLNILAKCLPESTTCCLGNCPEFWKLNNSRLLIHQRDIRCTSTMLHSRQILYHKLYSCVGTLTCWDNKLLHNLSGCLSDQTGCKTTCYPTISVSLHNYRLIMHSLMWRFTSIINYIVTFTVIVSCMHSFCSVKQNKEDNKNIWIKVSQLTGESNVLSTWNYDTYMIMEHNYASFLFEWMEEF